ncbi:MAG: hypothetical protein K2N58_02020 [Treponemataceae bacterium]|nr:hypothetical protein [Treponemataceae bacterium]
MRNFKFAVGACSFLAVCLFLFSCSSGLGESIDLEAPVLEITSPNHGVFVPKKFTLEGIATDNKRVNSVEIEWKYKIDGETKSGKQTAILSGEKWHCDFEFNGDYEVEFEAYAYDQLKNGSDTSHQRIMLLIDSQDPETDKMSIVRGDYVARLYPLEEFTKADGFTKMKNEPKNKDNFQNEKITLVTTLNDNYGIGTLSLDLYEVNPETKAETPVIEGISADSQDNKYSPRFTITEDMLPQKILAGVHYLRPYLNATDEAGNKVRRKEENVFAWESEYNRPHVSFSSQQSDKVLEIYKDSPIIVTVFDDDKLKSCRYSRSLVKEVDFKDKYSVPTDDYSFEKGSRDLSFEIDTKEFDIGSYYIVINAEDDSGRDDGKYFEAIKVNITNASAPVIIVDEPVQNSAPALTDGKFEIKGRVIDNEDNLNKIAIAWLPNGNDDIEKAKELFKNYDFGADRNGEIKIYKLDATPTDKVSGKPTYAFSKAFNFFDDFKVNGKTHNENKVFMIATKDPTGNLVTSTFRLSKISSAPKFKIGYENSDKQNAAPSETFMFTPLANRKTTFTITPYSESNLKITKFSVKGNDNGKKVDESKNSDDGIKDKITIEFNENEASLGKVYKYTLSATDQIGGTSNENLTIQFDQFGVLQSITCEQAANAIFLKGETIRLQANFDYKVYVNDTNKPYIQLSGESFKYKDGSDVPAEKRQAKYTGGNNSNTLYFEYKVTDEIECKNLTISNIEKNGAVLEGNINTFNSTVNQVNSKKYKIDSIAPYITGMKPGAGGVVEKKDGAVTITFEFNEPVTVESGTVIIQRTDGWYIPPVISEEVFLKIYNEKLSNPKDKETLCGTADLTSNEKYYTNTLMPKGPYMQYTNGITPDKNGNMVPDLTTKYVLAYEYSIGDKTGKVVELRGVLENAGYHKAEIDCSRMKPVGNSLTLEIKDSDFIGGLVNGVEYKVIFQNFKVYDKAYNYSTPPQDGDFQLNGSTYNFWVGPVATPVIRVNRTATNGIDDNPFDEGDVKTYLPGDVEFKTYATKFTRAARTTFKIDCETPGATVQYGTLSKSSTPVSKTNIEELNNTNNGEANDEHTNKIDDISSSAFNEIKTNPKANLTNGTSATIDIGEKRNDISEKIYIRAMAMKTGMKNNAAGKEGAFKTVLHYYLKPTNPATDWRKNNGGVSTKQVSLIKDTDQIQTPLRIHGAQVPEGSSFTAGWPLTQNGEARSDYQIAYTNGDGHFYWVSWQILDNFTLQTFSVDFQNPANPNTTYGIYHYCKNKAYWALTY